MNDQNAIATALRMLRARRDYYADMKPCDGIPSRAISSAYASAAEILAAAINENWEILNQYDYFGS